MPGFRNLQFQMANLDFPWDTVGSTRIYVANFLSVFSYTEYPVLRYTVAGGVSVASSTQAMCDAKQLLPTKYVIWADSFGMYLASGGNLLNTLMTYTVTCALTCIGRSDITFGMLLPNPKGGV